MSDWQGKVIDGRYEVLGVIGQGGMGVVLRARHRYTGGEVALKVLHPHLRLHGDLAGRFLAEARAPAAIGHAGIAAVSDAGVTSEGDLYVAMELLRGVSLSAMMRRGPMLLGDCVRILDEVLGALGAAHAAGFVHRDLKPDNIFVTHPTGAVKLLDFGIAKVMHEMGPGGQTATGAVMGTVAYMSPEQLRDSRKVDLRTDLWAVGVTLFQMVTGKLPFEAETFGEMLITVMSKPPRALAEVLPPPSIPAGLEPFLRRALSVDPAGRFASAAEMQAALRALLTPSAVAAAPPPQVSAPPPLAQTFTPAPLAAPPGPLPSTYQSPQNVYGQSSWGGPTPGWGTPAPMLAPPPTGMSAGPGSEAKWALGVVLGCVGVVVLGVVALVIAAAVAANGDDDGDCRAESCFAAGLRAEKGDGVPEDHARAVAYYDEACDDGYLLGCNALGNAYMNGFGGLTQDYAEARSLYERACDGAVMEGCHNLGWIYLNGLGVGADPLRARSFFAKSCKGGNRPSCEYVK